ncbi:RagB/SusD family nutrient uptake outer membrane protein [Arthrospiribacter ruber]|uniref:RagB/SusD family nutrient uptake outer membrane protein n=1 Tax=Arthrospiribacter ruber TaxID=2487934 RepID=A0A951IVP3_9BACT|nr:RagB/SusD family nutrient uptake outer membrane protein [Arthrospiribacter ruber]MBW3468095.1 RagB/SusD family nutrient uptake outer membrane protein [Arthrospiribacter ruber]
MKLNKINNIAASLLVGAGLVFASCDVTDQTPVTLVPEEEAFSDAQKVLGNILGVYDAAQRGFFLGAIQRGYPFGAASIQQADMRAGDMYNDQLFYEVTYIGAYSPSTANNAEFWISSYRLINRANVVLDGIETALENEIITQDEYNAYRAEMLFFRAYTHFELLMHVSRPYADNPESNMGIPYRDFAVNNTERVDEAIEIGRGTVAGTYERILQDLNEAEEIGSSSGAPFRASTSAAVALKLRIKLHQQDYNAVLEEFEKLDFSLAASPEVPFTSPAGNPESIFSLNNTPESNPGVNGALAAMYGNPSFGGRGLIKISPFFWNEDFWLEGDLRRTELTSSNEDGIYTAKYTGYIDRDDPTPLLRYAEAVLSAAEANARLGNLQEALALLNSVRDRAIPDDASSYTLADVGGNAEGLIEAILNEKRIEFLAEAIRWYDIHRLAGMGELDGVPAKTPSRAVTSIEFYDPEVLFGEDGLSPTHSIAYDESIFLWPIPLQEVVNNPTLAQEQNPGY